MDASFEIIKEIKPAYTRPSKGQEPELMERVEIAIVAGGWQILIPRNVYKPGDEVFYIRPDAMITNRAVWMSDEQKKYLGGRGRVKSIMLRGNVSEGMIINVSDLPDNIDRNAEDLCERLGIAHYEPPVSQDLSCKKNCLPTGIEKSDEENYQNLPEEDLHIGETVLVTKKMDGQSCTVYYNPKTDDFAICSRSMQLKLDKSNNFTNATRHMEHMMKCLASFYDEPIALRGEVCGQGIQNHKCNPDCKGPATFFLYGVRFPERVDRDERMGRYGTDCHFLKVNEVIKEMGFQPLPTVEILGEEVVSMEMLDSYRAKPASFGEGVVLNGSSFSYKAKSSEYYAKMK